MRQLVKTSTLLVVMAMLLGGCGKSDLTVTQARFVESLDKGSGNFDRVLELCFAEPVSSVYYHTVKITTKEELVITGAGSIRPLASEPDNKCHLRNLYSYIHKDSPIEARQLIKDYLVAGNIKELTVKIYADKPKSGDEPMTEKLFTDL